MRQLLGYIGHLRPDKQTYGTTRRRRGRRTGAGVWRSPPLLRRARLTTAFGLPPLRRGQYCLPPRVDAPGDDYCTTWCTYSLPYRRPRNGMVGHRPLDGSTASHPPCACAIAASKRGSCARRPSSRIAARTRTTAIVSDTPKDRVHGGQLSRGQQLARRQGDACRRRSRRRDGWSDQRREQPRSRSREPPTAVTSGRPMRTMIHEGRRPSSVQSPQRKRSTSREA